MARTTTEQIRQAIRKSNNILVTCKQINGIDSIASALGLALAIKKSGKSVDILCANFSAPRYLSFLPHVDQIGTKLTNLQQFIISVAATQETLEKLSYTFETDHLNIYLTPKTGVIDPKDISTKTTDYKYDLIFTVDTPDMASLGDIYTQATDFFFHTSIVNIDHQAENEEYGQINLIDLNAVSTSQVVYELIHDLNAELLDSDIATCLLTGMIAKTKSFKTANVTPRTLEIASELLNLEADREAIIKHLYRSRTLATLKLWGRVLTRLKHENNNQLVWSILTEQDFIESGAKTDELPDLIDELISFIPNVEVAVLLYQYQQKTYALVRSLKGYNAIELAEHYEPEGTKQEVTITIDQTDLQQAEVDIIAMIKKQLGKTA